MRKLIAYQDRNRMHHFNFSGVCRSEAFHIIKIDGSQTFILSTCYGIRYLFTTASLFIIGLLFILNFASKSTKKLHNSTLLHCSVLLLKILDFNRKLEKIISLKIEQRM